MTEPTADVRQIPVGFARTGASPRFDRGNLPDALQRDHRTAAGVYGRLVMFAGSLDFVTATGSVRLRAGDVHVIQPEQPHHVVPGEDMEFQIEFFRSAGHAAQ